MMFLIVIFFCGIVLFLSFGINHSYKRTEAYKNSNITKRRILDGIPTHLKIVNFGSNYMMYACNNYENLGIRGFSFSMPAQSLAIDEALLYQYSKNFSKGCIIVFGLAACVPFYSYSYCSDSEKYYDILEKKYLPDYSFKKEIKSLLVCSLKQLKTALKGILKPEGAITDITYFQRQIGNSEEIESLMQNYAKGWMQMFHLRNLKEANFEPCHLKRMEESTQILKRMFSFCKQKGFIPVVVLPPFGDELNKYYSESFISKSLKKCIKNTEMNIPIFDYRTNPSFQKHPELFLDGAFSLNKRGSLKWMKMFLQDLKKDGIIQNYRSLYNEKDIQSL